MLITARFEGCLWIAVGFVSSIFSDFSRAEFELSLLPTASSGRYSTRWGLGFKVLLCLT